MRITVMILGLLLCGTATAQPVLTGNAQTDFALAGSVVLLDPDSVDVGVPEAFAPAISGFDVSRIWVYHHAPTDTLYLGVQTFGVCGDADGDGHPDVTGPLLGASGGQDEIHLGGSESVAIMFDVNGDGKPDIVAGVPGDGSDFGALGTYEFDQSLLDFPGLAFGQFLEAYTGTSPGPPTPTAPHLELTIEDFSALAASRNSGKKPYPPAALSAFAGSSADLGFGDDYVPYQNDQVVICLDADQDGFTTCDPDCDDLDPNCGLDCSDTDNDGIPDCQDPCIDPDGDGFGEGGECPQSGADCLEGDPTCGADCSDSDADGIADCADDCLDADGDGYGKLAGCIGVDCDDSLASCTTDCSDQDGSGVPDCAEGGTGSGDSTDGGGTDGSGVGSTSGGSSDGSTGGGSAGVGSDGDGAGSGIDPEFPIGRPPPTPSQPPAGPPGPPGPTTTQFIGGGLSGSCAAASTIPSPGGAIMLALLLLLLVGRWAVDRAGRVT